MQKNHIGVHRFFTVLAPLGLCLGRAAISPRAPGVIAHLESSDGMSRMTKPRPNPEGGFTFRSKADSQGLVAMAFVVLGMAIVVGAGLVVFAATII
jgi:hypothetical protein